MSDLFFLKYKTAGGADVVINPNHISHIYPKTGLTVVTMRNGHEFHFDSPLQDFIERISKDMVDANR